MVMRACWIVVTLLLLAAATPARAADAELALGRAIFVNQAEPQCALCHTLADAKSAGQVGPVLDDLKPTAERVAAAVTNGIGVMPAYEGLTKAQIDAVALYVATVAGRP